MPKTSDRTYARKLLNALITAHEGLENVTHAREALLLKRAKKTREIPVLSANEELDHELRRTEAEIAVEEAGRAPRVRIEPNPMIEQKRLHVELAFQPKPDRMETLNVILLIVGVLALVALLARAHGSENPAGNSVEIPVKSTVPMSSPAPTTP